MLEVANLELSPVPSAIIRRLQGELKCSETLAWVLARRGARTSEAARKLLDQEAATTPAAFHDPLLLGDMVAAVERLRFAITRGEKIVIHGDYDCDGVCSTTLLCEALEALGANVLAHVPNRFDYGYGLHIETIEQFAREGCRVLVTVDCGISSVDEIAHARDLGMDAIICDHHEPRADGVLPGAILCSTRPSEYPFPHLCATAVAGKLAQALGAPYGSAQHELEAIATIADVVPLTGENRAIVMRGLRALRTTKRLGLKALLTEAGIRTIGLDEQDVAFKIAPRINAAGRIDRASRAYDLLRAASPAEAKELAHEIHALNAKRRELGAGIVDEAVAQIEGWDEAQRAAPLYVVDGPTWHEGIVGIVAARLVERYHRPVVVIAATEPLARGSARSIPGFDLHAALTACADTMVRCGGHAAAAGLTVEPTRIAELRTALVAYASTKLGADDLRPLQIVDAIVAGDEISIDLAEELSQLAPFGHGNPKPRLLACAAKPVKVRAIGKHDTHMRATLRIGGVEAEAVAFGRGHLVDALASANYVDACFSLTINRFRGHETVELLLDRVIDPATVAAPAAGLCKTACDYACHTRIDLGSVLQRALEDDPLAHVDPTALPALEPLLARPSTIDLRARNRAVAHVARLLTAGESTIVVCADVARRRALLDGALEPTRFGATAAVLTSGRCATLALRRRVERATQTAHVGSAILLFTDYEALDDVTQFREAFEHVVVLDPPVTDLQRDQLLQIERPLHLVFGAAERRFALAAAAAVADARATLATSWKALRHGPLSGVALERTLFGTEDAPFLHSPAAVANALRELRLRNLATITLARLEVAPTLAYQPQSADTTVAADTIAVDVVVASEQ